MKKSVSKHGGKREGAGRPTTGRSVVTRIEGASVCALLFAELARQYTEIKLVHDDEDGFFIQRESGYRVDGWVTMDTYEAAKRETVEEALVAAVEWHNADLKQSQWKKRISLTANALEQPRTSQR